MVGAAAFRIRANQRPVFSASICADVRDPLNVQMPRNPAVLQHQRGLERFRLAPVCAVCGAAKLNEAVLIVPSGRCNALIGVVRPHQPCIRITTDNGRRLHIVVIG